MLQRVAWYRLGMLKEISEMAGAEKEETPCIT
jgi:hypothetical protein